MQIFPRGLTFIALTAGFCALPADAQSLSTLFTGGIGGGVGGANYFDVTVTNAGGIRITSFDQNCLAVASTVVGIMVYTTPTTSMGNEGNLTPWTLVATGRGVAAGPNVPTPIDTSDFSLSAGSYGMAIVAVNTSLSYTDGIGGNLNYGNADIALTLGTATNVPFTLPLFTPRVWNGAIYYVGAGSGVAAYGVHGGGCKGTNNLVPVLAAAPGRLPKINNTFTTAVTNMPAASPGALQIFGTSKTSYSGIPLPFPLAGIGMPGCDLLASILITQFITNRGGTGTWSISIPNSPALLGSPFYNQALVVDPGANAADLTASNGGEGCIGM